jgi:hypothetical protein
MAYKRQSMRRSEEWWATAPSHIIRCSGQKPSTGERCAREALPGGTVCKVHGGTLPAVQAAAATRIGLIADSAISQLIRIMEDPEAEDRDVIAVAKDLLDRAGLGATNKLLVGIGQVDPVERLFMDILSDPNGLSSPAPLPAEKLYQDEGDDSPLLALESGREDVLDIVDAEVIEDDAPARERQEVNGSSRPPKWLEDDLARLL